ncbi:MAG: nitroreductase [Euryarchaeota archaeon RBG_19FT_COMBO_69_17]|nr:MAG: nitroreductase [Euryarchaeota archaeon RBG_19FT_COMBO_69_17]
MELQDAIRGRRSVRAFRADPVPEERLRELLEMAQWAPSAGNLQARDFVVVREDGAKRALARLSLDQGFVAQAPVVVVVCGNLRRVDTYGRRGRDLFVVQDAAAATQNLLLAAHEVGLGTCWVGAFDEDGVRKLLGLPIHVRPLALVPLGRPAEDPEPSTRLPLDELVHWDAW